MDDDNSQENTDLQVVRGQIDQLRKNKDFDGIKDILGITIVERAEDRPDGEDCVAYVFGKEGKSDFEQFKDLMRIVTEGSETTEPKEGDYVVYFDRDGNWTHVGFSTGGDLVKSKFDDAHVYEHPSKFVPTEYGEEIKFFVNPNTSLKKN